MRVIMSYYNYISYIPESRGNHKEKHRTYKKTEVQFPKGKTTIFNNTMFKEKAYKIILRNSLVTNMKILQFKMERP